MFSTAPEVLVLQAPSMRFRLLVLLMVQSAVGVNKAPEIAQYIESNISLLKAESPSIFRSSSAVKSSRPTDGEGADTVVFHQ